MSAMDKLEDATKSCTRTWSLNFFKAACASARYLTLSCLVAFLPPCRGTKMTPLRASPRFFLIVVPEKSRTASIECLF